MGRFVAGVISALLFVSAGIFIWRGQVENVSAISAPPFDVDASPMTLADVSEPPTATEKTREQKRFSRYDKDKNGAVARDEYLIARRKAFAKFDVNGDGRLVFEEYAIKTTSKFAKADSDQSGQLTPTEFLATRIVRKLSTTKCPPPRRTPLRDVAPQSEDGDES